MRAVAAGGVARAMAGRAMTMLALRPARRDESGLIAELFEISSDGVASYVWSTLQADYPGLPLLQIGQRRYEREQTEFSYQNCLLAAAEGRVLGMLHAYRMAPHSDSEPDPAPIDPVLKPYADLEAPGTLYIAAIAVWPDCRGRGVGSRLLAAARERARDLELRELSLLCFAGNTGARRLYERAGFVVADWRPVVPHPLIRYTGDVLLMQAPA